MKHMSRLRYVDDDGFQSEIDAVARMTPEEVREGLRRLGIEPTRVLPWELKRLLDETPPPGLQARAEDGLLSSVAESFGLLRFVLRARRGPVLTMAFILSLAALPMLRMVIEVRDAGGLEAVSFSRHRDDGGGVPQPLRYRIMPSREGEDAGPCNKSEPCGTLAGAVGKVRARGEIAVLKPGDARAATFYQVTDF
jgi:hypothetical protein